MPKPFFLLRSLPALALVATLFFQNHLAAQNLQVERLPYYSSDIAFWGNDLWEITEPTLIKRDLVTGEVKATFDTPIDVGANRFRGSISIDLKGDIWLALGQNGVVRFDGIDQWKIWTPQSTPIFPAGIAFFKSGVEAATGHVWMYGSVGSISYCFVFDGSVWKEEVSLRDLHFTRFTNGPKGEFVICSNDSLLLRQNNTWVPIPEPEGGPIFNATFDNQGHMWVTSGFAKLYRYDNLSSTPEEVTNINDRIFEMLFDDSGNLYAATDERGIGKWNGTGWTFSSSLAGAERKTWISGFRKDPLGRFWITQGIYAVHALTLWSNDAPQKNFYYGIQQAVLMECDRMGNMWFGCEGPLMVRKNGHDGSLDYFEMFDFDNFEFNKYSTELKLGIGSDLWLKTSQHKLLHYDGMGWSQFALPDQPKYFNGYCIDSKGRLYISGYSPPGNKTELKFCDLGAAVWTKVDFSIFGNWNGVIGELEVDEVDNLWFGSTEGLGKRNTSDGLLEIYPLPNDNGWGLPYPPRVQTGPGGMVYVVAGSNVWGDTTGLLRFNSATSTWQEISWPDPSILQLAQTSSTHLKWHVDQQGRVWIAANLGFETLYWYWDDGFWTEIKGMPNESTDLVNEANDIASDSKGNIYIGFVRFLARFKTAGRIEGTLHNDLDDNCQTSTADPTLANFTVVATDGKSQYLGLSRPDGSYRVHSGSEKVTVRAVPTNPLWRDCNPNGTALTLSPDQPTQLDFMLQAEVDCPHMTVDVSTPFLRRCFNNTYTVRACNDGTAAAKDAYVDITLPAEMEMKSANKPYTTAGPQQYRFPIGDLAVGACAVFQFVAYVKCDNTSIGQTLCVLAQVYPDTICIQTASHWKGATVLLDARCEGDSVRFSIENSGTAATSQPVDYQLLRNEAVYSIGSLSLQPGQHRSLTAPADGATWRLSTAQEPAHPFLPRTPSLAVEACAPTAGGFDQGFVNSQPNSSGSGFEDLDCQTIVGSLDPNDKAASPTGIGENTHFVLPGTELEYRIRFQNTGTDTAFTVVVRDTLSASLDFATFVPGASSHAYRLDARGNALAFVFDNILLPDSNTNLAASQGFVQFRIRPRRDIPLGTVLSNSAAIYFDFNAAVVTNSVWHVVDSSFQQTSAVGDPQPQPQGPRLWVFPNPAAQGSFWVKTPADSGTLHVYDAQGRLQHTLRVQGASAPVQVDCAHLPDGLYLLRFFGKNRADAVSGKVVLRGN